MVNKIYTLELNTSRDGENEYDATMVPFNESDKVCYYFSNPKIYPFNLLPKIMYFEANFNYIPEIDIPFTNTSITIMSKNTLRIFEKFDNTILTVPIVMIDDTWVGDKFDIKGNINPDIPTNIDYVAIRLSEHKSYFDYEHSYYRPLRSNPSLPGRIKKLVLKEPDNGFPNLFRIEEKASLFFISDNVKTALEDAGIKGCFFEEVEVSLRNKYV